MNAQIINAAQAAIVDVNLFFVVVYGIPLLLIAIYYGIRTTLFMVGFAWGFVNGLMAKPEELTQQEIADFEERLSKSLRIG